MKALIMSRLRQKLFHDKRYLQSWVTHLVLLAFLNQNLAFATQSIIELDFKDSQTPQRLHVIPRMSNIGDVSHLEIDTEHKQVAIYLKEKQEEDLDEIENHLSQGGDVPVTMKSVILQKHNIINLPWELEPEKLTLFILNHTALLKPLGEDDYKLEFRGSLLGGMKKNNAGGGMNDRVKISIITRQPPNPDLYYLDMFRYISEMAQYQSEISHMMAHNARIDQEEKEQKAKEEKQKKEKEAKEKLEIEKQKQEHPVFYGEYEHFKKIHHLAGTEKTWEAVYKYSDSLGYAREFVKRIDWKRPFSFTDYLQTYNPFYGGYEEFKKIHYLAGTEKSYETVFKYSDPLGYDRTFVKSIDWKSTYTFETYLQAYNPFYQDYSQIKEIHRLVNTVIYPEVFKYSSPLGYSEDFVRSVPYKEPMKSFEGYMNEVFDDQMLEDWGVKDWREAFALTEEDAEFMQVTGKGDLIIEILKFGTKGTGLLKKAWQKAVQTYKGEIVKGLKIDKGTLNKIPKEFGDLKLNRKGVGIRWGQEKGKNCVRIDKGNPNAPLPSQRVDHVRINSNDKVLDQNGNPIQTSKPSKTEEAHIPLEVWKQWKDWNKP